MFPAVLTRSGSEYVQRLVVVTLAAILAFATMVATHPTAAEAHVETVDIISCLGWSVDLSNYSEDDDNSVEIWVDGDLVTDLGDFGTEYRETGTWDGFFPHTLRVRVVAWDDPDGALGWSFETTRTSVACPEPQIDIEKATNGQDADGPTGPEIEVGTTVTWTYVITNTGNVPLTNVTVTDDEEGPICTVGDLAVGATETCTASGTAVQGQYTNEGTVTGVYAEGPSQVTDTDPSHYFGVPAPVPGIHIEKATNGFDADAPNGPTIVVGDTVTWTYVVTNTGDVPLGNIRVTDDKGVIPRYVAGDTDSDGLLDLAEAWEYQAEGIAEPRLYANIGTVVGDHGGKTVTDSDPSHYTGSSIVKGTSQLGDTVWLDANKNGVQDPGEQGLNGACVNLKDANGNVIATLSTVATPWNGFYKFVGLDAGTYTAAIDMTCVKSSYELTTASSFTVTLEEGVEYVDADFGLYEGPATTTVPPTTTTQAPETLPSTGMNSGGLTVLAVALLMLGGLAILATRKRNTTD